MAREDTGERIRRRYGLDVLLWGPYVAPGSTVRNMNFVIPMRRRTSDTDLESTRAAAERDPFDPNASILEASVLVDQRNNVDCYLLAILTVLLVFETRRTLVDNDRARKTKQTGFWSSLRAADPFYLSSEDEQGLMFYIAFKLLPELEITASDKIFGTAADLGRLLVEFLTRWNGGQIDRLHYEKFNDAGWNEAMAGIAKYVAKHRPDEASIQYRRAAWACMCGQETETRAALNRAKELDGAMVWFGPIGVTVAAEMALTFSHEGRRAGAMCYVARALAVGGKAVKPELQEAWNKTDTARFWKYSSLESQHLADRLLHEMLGTPKTVTPEVTEPSQ